MKNYLTFSAFILLFVLTQWSSSLYLPIVPSISNIFSPHNELIVSSLSLFFLGYALGQLFWGILSDYISRYLTLLISLSLYCIFELSMLSVNTAAAFVTILSITGFLTSANTSVGNAIIKELYAEKTKAVIGYIGIAMACAPVVAPMISSNLYFFWRWQSIFIFLSLVGLLTFLFFIFNFIFSFKQNTSLKNRKHSVTKTSILCMLKETLLDRKFTLYILILCFSFGILFSILLITPFVLVNYADFPIQNVGITMFTFTSTYIIGSIFNVVLAKKKESAFIVNTGLLFMSFASGIFLVNSIIFSTLITPVNLISVAICMLGIGIVLPASKAGAMITRNQYVGTAASVMKFTQTMGGVILTRLASHAINHDYIASFLIIMVIIILLLTLFSIGMPMMVNIFLKNKVV